MAGILTLSPCIPVQARKMWGATLNRVRDLARQTLSYMDEGEERDEVLRYLMAFPYAFKDHLLREDHLVDDMRVRRKACVLLSKAGQHFVT